MTVVIFFLFLCDIYDYCDILRNEIQTKKSYSLTACLLTQTGTRTKCPVNHLNYSVCWSFNFAVRGPTVVMCYFRQAYYYGWSHFTFSPRLLLVVEAAACSCCAKAWSWFKQRVQKVSVFRYMQTSKFGGSRRPNRPWPPSNLSVRLAPPHPAGIGWCLELVQTDSKVLLSV